METQMEVIVRSTEIDGNGHVNNAKYLEYLEWARQEWYEVTDLGPKQLEPFGIQMVTVNININYRKEARQGDVLQIRTALEKLGRSSLVVTQKIYNQSGDLVADALTTRVAIDKNSRKSCPIPDEIKHKLAAFCG